MNTPSSASPLDPPLWKRLIYGRNLKRTLLRALVLAVTAFVVFKFILLPVRISGESMLPAYRDGGINFINQLAYVWGKPRRGDVVAVMMSGRHALLFKRIVGLPGETVAIVDGVVQINGQALSEPYVLERTAWQLPPRQLPADEYFLIGDNRDMPQNTHTFGATKVGRIAGKALW